MYNAPGFMTPHFEMMNRTLKIFSRVTTAYLLAISLSQAVMAADRFTQALTLMEQKKYPAAIQLLQKLIQESPKSIAVRNNLAVALAANGDLELADQSLQQALATEPNLHTVHSNLNRLYAWRASQAYSAALGNNQSVQFPGLKTLAKKEQQVSAPVVTLKPVTPAPAKPVSATSFRPKLTKQQVSDVVEQWRSAWAQQQPDAYLSNYTENFRPNSRVSNKLWRQQRIARIKAPRSIKLALEKVTVQPITETFALASFRQKYSSDSYSDATDKILVLEKINNTWKITHELNKP